MRFVRNMELLKDAKIQLEDEWINIKIPLSALKDISKVKDWSFLDKVRGMWKGKKIEALEYQKRLRQEWD